MGNPCEDMTELVRSLVTPLVDSPDALEIIASEEEAGVVMVEIDCDEADTGKVIGRQGRVIKAIRTLCRAAGSRGGYHVEVELVD
jgi:predicted RNA-binding protein YlqC (UPF0109 family)